MPRPRSFEETDVIERALQVFWARGYEATSLTDLEEATGLRRASLYGAFGDKEGLFIKALERFLERYDAMASTLESAPSAREGFAQVFEQWLSTNCTSAGPRGCMVQLVAQTTTGELPRVRALLERASGGTEIAFRRAFERAADTGELPKHADPRQLARFMMVGLQGVSAAARAGLSRTHLRSVIARLIASAFADLET